MQCDRLRKCHFAKRIVNCYHKLALSRLRVLVVIFSLLSVFAASNTGYAKDTEYQCAKALLIESKTPALDALEQYLNQQSTKERMNHSLNRRNDHTSTLGISYLRKKQSRFMRLVLMSIMEGSLTKIDAGAVVGPKVLNMISNFQDGSKMSQQPISIIGITHVGEIYKSFEKQVLDSNRLNEARRKAQNEYELEVMNELTNEADYWTDKDMEDFVDAVQKLGIKELCLKYGFTSLVNCGIFEFKIQNYPENRIEWMLLK